MHPLASAYMSASISQNTFNPVYDQSTKDYLKGKYSMELSTNIGDLIDLTPLLNQHLIQKVLIPAAKLREQRKIGAILILSNTTIKTQLTWFDEYMYKLTKSAGQFQSLLNNLNETNSKPLNRNQKPGNWQHFDTSIIDWEDKKYFFDYIMERNNRARGDLTFVKPPLPNLGCLGGLCIFSPKVKVVKNPLDWSRKTIGHVTHITRKLGIRDPRNIFFFDDLSPTNELHHPVADDLKEKYVHIRSKAPDGRSERDGYGVIDTYEIEEGSSYLKTMTPYKDATVYPQSLLYLLETATPKNVGKNLRVAENSLPTVGGKRRRITKHKKTMKRRQARSRRRL